jgi:hypothetical protein
MLYFSRKYASILVGYETLQEIGDRDSLAHKFKETHSYEHGAVNTAMVSLNLSLT